MTIAVGDKIPSATLFKMTGDGPAGVTTDEVFSGKKVVMFGVPGAFTPTCSETHLPGFMEKAGEIKAKGVDSIVCVSVNDVFVMNAWSKDRGVGPDVELLADGSAELTKAMGLELDLSARGLGLRAQRFAMIVNDGTVDFLATEEVPSTAEKTAAAAVLENL